MSGATRLEQADDALERWRGERVVVGWSGGLDSTVLIQLARAHGVHVVAVHVDHGLRASSARDAAFCARQARRWGIPIDLVRIDVRGSGSSQERARLQRYAALADAAIQTGASAVMTAHHGEDAVETALLNRERGAREFGLTSLLRRGERGPIPSWPERVTIERPLLGLLRSDIEEYATEHRLDWVEDPTNATTNYRRNQIRHALLPALTDSGAHMDTWLASLSDIADRADAWQREADELLSLSMLAPMDAETRALAAAPFADASDEACVRALTMAAHQVACALRSEHLNQLMDTLRGDLRTRISVPGGVASVWDDLIFIERARGRGGKHLSQRSAPARSLPLDSAETCRWFDTRLEIQPVAENVASEPLLDASDGVSLEGGATRIPSDQGDRPVPMPMRWRWPLLRAGAESLALSSRAVYARRGDGRCVQITWDTGRDTAWDHACRTTES